MTTELHDNVKRLFNINEFTRDRSVLLLGPRQTGKSTLLKSTFPEAVYVDLLASETFRTLSAKPETLRESLKGHESLIIIDEIQKLPELLDEVQLLIDRNKQLRFVLTGSSARKLKRGRANLLGGRAASLRLFPLTTQELGDSNINRLLLHGGLPGIHFSNTPEQGLSAYVGAYLQEEIQAEGYTRNLPQFSRFLDVVALSNGEQINYTAIGSDCWVKPQTVRDHFQVLYDTLVAYPLQPYAKTKKRKPVATEKFYLFDLGVANALTRRTSLVAGTPEYGKAVEHLIFLELMAYNHYSQYHAPLNYWRSQNKQEVDFIYDEKIAIEVKAKQSVGSDDLKGLRALKEEMLQKRFLCVSLEKTERRTDDGIEILPLATFLEKLWSGDFKS